MHDPEQAIICQIPVLISGRMAMVAPSRWDETSEYPSEVKLCLEINGKVLEARSQRGYFHALCDLRTKLEADGVLIACLGASENIYPSPMIESMGCGEKAYKLTLGKPALKQDLVSIFDYEASVAPTTVENQKRFYELWLTRLQ